MDRLAEIPPKSLEYRGSNIEQPLLTCPGCEREEFPAETIVTGRRVSVNKPTLGERFQRPRYLTLFPPEQLCGSCNPQAPILECLITTKNYERGKFLSETYLSPTSLSPTPWKCVTYYARAQPQLLYMHICPLEAPYAIMSETWLQKPGYN